jgi:hypothetical protein
MKHSALQNNRFWWRAMLAADFLLSEDTARAV